MRNSEYRNHHVAKMCGGGSDRSGEKGLVEASVSNPSRAEEVAGPSDGAVCAAEVTGAGDDDAGSGGGSGAGGGGGDAGDDSMAGGIALSGS
ncbi:MAG: hypothetical protein DRJ50_01370 [Actinobacteria bacterium]|nr:MAG: hypothetical protein DRJ50_01370 [Actinomycetota bacterium]